MIYAIRHRGRRDTLVEFESWSRFDLANDFPGMFTEVSTAKAEKWVRDGKEHETGLFINDDGEVVYAEAEA